MHPRFRVCGVGGSQCSRFDLSTPMRFTAPLGWIWEPAVVESGFWQEFRGTAVLGQNDGTRCRTLPLAPQQLCLGTWLDRHLSICYSAAASFSNLRLHHVQHG